MATWPEGVNDEAEQDGFREAPPQVAIRTKMEHGPEKIRRDRTVGSRKITARYVLSATELAIWIDWFNTTIEGGAVPFDLPHPRTRLTRYFRIIETPRIDEDGNDRFNLTLSMEIAPLPLSIGAAGSIIIPAPEIEAAGGHVVTTILDADFSLGDMGDGIAAAVVTGSFHSVSNSGSTTTWAFNKAGVMVKSTVGDPIYAHRADGSFLGCPHRGANVQSAIYVRDMTNAAWTKSNVSAALDATGLDGVANSASTITATDANGTATQAITASSGSRQTQVWIKPVVLNGTVELTDNNGTNWTDVTADLVAGEWREVGHLVRTQANPVIGIRLSDSGDSVECDMWGCYNGTRYMLPGHNPSSPGASTSIYNHEYRIIQATNWGAAWPDFDPLNFAIIHRNYVPEDGIAPDGRYLCVASPSGGLGGENLAIFVFGTSGPLLRFQMSNPDDGTAFFTQDIGAGSWNHQGEHVWGMRIWTPSAGNTYCSFFTDGVFRTTRGPFAQPDSASSYTTTSLGDNALNKGNLATVWSRAIRIYSGFVSDAQMVTETTPRDD